jgi:type VI protein secretion system component Hcp
MAEPQTPNPSKMTTPKFMFTMDDMGMESLVKGFEKYTEVINWGLGAHCYSTPQVSGTFSQQQPPSCSPLYLRLPIGLHMPKLIKSMITKKPSKKAELIMLGSINNTNTELMALSLESVTVEEVNLGSAAKVSSIVFSPNEKHDLENTFEVQLRFGKIEWKVVSYKQLDGKKEGQDTAGLNLQTGEAV